MRRVRRLYAERRETLLAALADHWPADGEWIEPAGGNCVWVSLPGDADPETVLRAARGRGIAYTRGDAFFFDGGGVEHLCLSFARLPCEAIGSGVRELAAVIGRVRARRSA